MGAVARGGVRWWGQQFCGSVRRVDTDTDDLFIYAIAPREGVQMDDLLSTQISVISSVISVL